MTLLKGSLFLLICLCSPNDNQAWWYKTKDWEVSATGCVRCYDEPIRDAEVKLMDEDYFYDDIMASSQTDSNGCFSLSGKGRDNYRGKPDPYIKVGFVYSGKYGKLEVEKYFGINRYGYTGTKRYASKINFGNITFANIHCKSYVRFYDAMKEFNKRTGLALPYNKLHVRTGSRIHGGTPYSTTNVVHIPRNYPVSSVNQQTAFHELALTLRHSYDGNFFHFLYDASIYSYTRKHNCSKKTNDGFAFNEGWAEFWAGECKGRK